MLIQGALPDEDADTQESANMHMEKNQRLTRQAMALPDAVEWAAAEPYELNQLARLDAYSLHICHLIIKDWMLLGLQIKHTLMGYLSSTEPVWLPKVSPNVLVKISQNICSCCQIESIHMLLALQQS